MNLKLAVEDCLMFYTGNIDNSKGCIGTNAIEEEKEKGNNSNLLGERRKN